jgi:hypothetical protein
VGAGVNAAIGSAIRQSSQDFVNDVWPHVAPMIGGGAVLPIETLTADSLARDLDMLAGIDLLHYTDDGGLRGIASRVQYNRPEWASRFPWDTFTVRKARANRLQTEYQKRMRDIDHGYLYPYLTVQAYIDSQTAGRLVSAAVVRTLELYAFLDEHGAASRQVTGGAEMYVIRWTDLEDADVPIKVVRQ